MAIVRAQPATTPTTVRAEIQKELSGIQWCSRYPRSKSIVTLQPSFQLAVSSFLWALQEAGATYDIKNTFRPKEACYLMHYAWLIWKRRIKPENVPENSNVPIEWKHQNSEASVQAATDMCATYQLLNLQDAPALESNHTKGLALDVVIRWAGALNVKNANDAVVSIESLPRDNMNAELWKVGATYGVLRYFRADKDKPHWSVDGR